MKKMKILIGSDHHGTEIRRSLTQTVNGMGLKADEIGPPDGETVANYPDVASQVARAVSEGQVDRGVLICGTGIGMSIVANKFPNVRAAPVVDAFTAELSRMHNNLNVLCLSADMLAKPLIRNVVQTWLRTDFSDKPRYDRQLERIAQIERDQIRKNKAAGS
jgi:ribose 5-phosphate isomerase B